MIIQHPETSPELAQLLRRFTVAERWIHRGAAALLGTAMISAAFLYLPLLAGLFSRAFRADLARLNRFGPHDRGWLRATLRRRSHPAGKFNAGQKMYAALAGGGVLVMAGTGLIMWFPKLTPLFARTGATFVHDWAALLLGAAVIGHIWMAADDPEARRGLRTGLVSRSWARRHHALWEREEPGED
jgi:formate dehydrogenase subunit gamma